jgi:hypothetical protein
MQATPLSERKWLHRLKAGHRANWLAVTLGADEVAAWWKPGSAGNLNPANGCVRAGDRDAGTACKRISKPAAPRAGLRADM